MCVWWEGGRVKRCVMRVTGWDEVWGREGEGGVI